MHTVVMFRAMSTRTGPDTAVHHLSVTPLLCTWAARSLSIKLALCSFFKIQARYTRNDDEALLYLIFTTFNLQLVLQSRFVFNITMNTNVKA